ncbi:conserved protein of unknown function [Sterolibacterium denitrificans]|nr:nucleotidyltransferase [Sterolibacterium denitrificans]SMB21310.1 conserved protein of unknown function [Sterolibacterium denitrificans]
MRRDIASLAARLMAADGIDDFSLAKRKAARQLGAPNSEALPTNQEVETALLAYQALYQEDEQRERLAVMRREALALMQRLRPFHPYLTGPVLIGTAGRYSRAEIDLYADSGKEVEIFLLDQHLDFEHVDPGRGPEAPELRLLVTGEVGKAGETTGFLLSVYPHGQERVRRRSPHTGQSERRAGIEALTALLAAEVD